MTTAGVTLDDHVLCIVCKKVFVKKVYKSYNYEPVCTECRGGKKPKVVTGGSRLAGTQLSKQRGAKSKYH